MEGCFLCPRQCGADRAAGERGFCGADGTLRVARAGLHAWEEPCLSGDRGSGTVFFTGCNLQCVFCQNRQISMEGVGKVITVPQLTRAFLSLQEQGAHNLNLVTGTAYLPQIKEALELARAKGLTLPVVWNSGGYESVESLRQLEGLVDIYLPDFKFYDPAVADRYTGCPDYPAVAWAAIGEMVRQVGEPRFDGDEMMTRGVIVRHLLLPDEGADSKKAVEALYREYGDKIYLSLMNQYTPMGRFPHLPNLERPITAAEYEDLLEYAISLGLENGFIQEGGTVSESFIPAFDGTGIPE